MLCRKRLRLTLYSQHNYDMKKSATVGLYVYLYLYHVGARVNYCELNSTSLLFAASLLYYVLYSIKFFCPIR
jgi:hypothetical protein